MNFVEPAFFLFFPLTALLHRLVPARSRWAVLLAASLFFYAWHNVWLLFLLLATVLISYLCALGIESAKTEAGKNWALAMDLLFCFGSLFLFKYLNLALQGLNALGTLLGFSPSFSAVNLILPMGISFYVFQTASYTLDVYRGTIKAERHFGYYALFVTFFPQLVAGPIERPGDLLPQLKEPVSPDAAASAEWVVLLLRGFGKKLLIADFLAVFVDRAYSDVANFGGLTLLIATALFGLQIYCDFSGYTDIARGCAGIMGIRLRENFRRPYTAVSVRDFWRRWHISLTSWFTDYVYIPLGGSRRGLLRQCRNILIVFAFSGLWHGADVTFLIWGCLHGIYLVGETLLLPKDGCKSCLGRLCQRFVTLGLITFAWIFFRAANLEEALIVVQRIFTQPSFASFGRELPVDSAQLLITMLLIAVLPVLEKLPALLPKAEGRAVHTQARIALLYFLLVTAIVFARCWVLTQHGQTAFLYFQF